MYGWCCGDEYDYDYENCIDGLISMQNAMLNFSFILVKAKTTNEKPNMKKREPSTLHCTVVELFSSENTLNRSLGDLWQPFGPGLVTTGPLEVGLCAFVTTSASMMHVCMSYDACV